MYIAFRVSCAGVCVCGALGRCRILYSKERQIAYTMRFLEFLESTAGIKEMKIKAAEAVLVRAMASVAHTSRLFRNKKQESRKNQHRRGVAENIFSVCDEALSGCTQNELFFAFLMYTRMLFFIRFISRLSSSPVRHKRVMCQSFFALLLLVESVVLLPG